ncbi:Zn(II)2Cys6 transcription factor [Aspergillus undulatus]|uniref:Zn(II)2Cys6 transcription factor n=1 Tax=Aspergillus undulatus TaxID=1810928 RepID=UPI003CCCF7E8
MNDTPPRNQRSTPHSRSGCLTCRRRKKKCDEHHPICTACLRNALDCVWPSPETAPSSRTRRHRRRQVLAGRAVPAELATMVTVFPLSTPDLVRRLLHHFTDYGPMWLTSRTGKSRTAILFHLFPEAMDSPLILHCVLMIAAEDLLKYDCSAHLQAAAVEYYGQAVAGLREALGSETQGDDLASVTDQTLLAIALFCLHESQNYSNTARLLPHLNGAATLLRRRLNTTAPNLNLRNFLFEMFCYFFSVVAFTDGSSFSFGDSSYIFDSPALHDHLQPGTIMGTSQKAFPIIFRLARYLSLSRLDSPSCSSSIPIPKRIVDPTAQLDLLQTAHELQTCRPPFQVTRDMEPGTITDGVTFELYRLAYLVHLKHIINPTTSVYDPPVQEMVASFIAYLVQLPPESPSDGFLCWPLVIAGLRAVDRSHQVAIAERLKSIYQRYRSEIFSRNLAFLRRLWKEERGVESRYGYTSAAGREYPALLA